MEFVETRVFTARASKRLDDDALRGLQSELLHDPEKGAVVPGCGGLRKVRVADEKRAKGKRGGSRVLYVYMPEADRIDLITIYGKNEKDDLTPEEKRQISDFLRELKREALSARRRRFND